MKKKENRNLFILLLDFIQCNLLFTWSRWRKTVLSLYSSKQIIIYSFFNRSAICYMNVIERETFDGTDTFISWYISKFMCMYVGFCQIFFFSLFLLYNFAQHEIQILCMLITQPINPLLRKY